MEGDVAYGLSKKNRDYIVGIVFLALLIFGPVEAYGQAIRLIYLTLIPAGLWLALRYAAEKLHMDSFDNDRLYRAITAAIAGMLTVAAYQSATAPEHSECTQLARDGQGGHECVGEIVIADGADPAAAFMWLVLAGVAFWLATSRKSN